MASTHDLSAWDKDERLFLFTSMTAGSSHIVTATSRLETILNANRVPFLAIDMATNESGRRLWARRSAGKKLPGLVKDGYVIADLEEVEEWNEFGEINQNIGDLPPLTSTAPPGGDAITTRATMHATTQPLAQLNTKPKPTASTSTPATKSTQSETEHVQSSLESLAMKDAAAQAAAIAAARKNAKLTPLPASTPVVDTDNVSDTDTKTTHSSSDAKVESTSASKDASDQVQPSPPEPSKSPEVVESSSAEPSDHPPEVSATAGSASNEHAKDGISHADPKEEESEVSATAGSASNEHAKDSVSHADPEEAETKEPEQSTATPKVEGEDEEQPKTQSQETAAADMAAVSVQD